MKLPDKFKTAARHCYDGAVNRVLLSRLSTEAIEFCHNNNIPLESDDCPPEIIVILAQLTHLLGMPDASMSDRYHDAIKALGFI